jgi:hypothetical protein
MDGLFPMSAVNLIREKRTPFALFNQNYVTWLTEQARDEVKDFLESKHPSIINLIPHIKGK